MATRLPVLRELPPGFVVEEGERGILAVRGDCREVLRAAGFGPDGGQAPESPDLSGRGPLGELRGPAGGRLVVRPFRHGGLLRWLTGTRFADPERPFRELLLASALVAEGIPTPAVVAARARPAPLGGWRLDLVSERAEETVDLARVLEALREGGVGEPARARILEAVGELVGRLHRAGVRHADLQPRNLLVARSALEGGAPRPAVLDLEGSRRGEMDRSERLANLARLARAVARRESRGRPFLRRGDWARFLRAYDRGLGRPAGSWRADWRALAPRVARPALRHRLGWLLEDLVGGVERRDGAASVPRP